MLLSKTTATKRQNVRILMGASLVLVKLVTLEMASYASNSPERSYDQRSKRGNFDFFQVKTATRESENLPC